MIKKCTTDDFFKQELTPFLSKWHFQETVSRLDFPKNYSEKFVGFEINPAQKPKIVHRLSLKEQSPVDRGKEMDNLLKKEFVQNQLDLLEGQLRLFEKYLVDLIKYPLKNSAFKKIKEVIQGVDEAKKCRLEIKALKEDAFLAQIFKNETLPFSIEFVDALLRTKRQKECIYSLDANLSKEQVNSSGVKSYILNAPQFSTSFPQVDIQPETEDIENPYSREYLKKTDFYQIRYSKRFYNLLKCLAQKQAKSFLNENGVDEKSLVCDFLIPLFKQVLLLWRLTLSNNRFNFVFEEEKKLTQNVIESWNSFSKLINDTDKSLALWRSFLEAICHFDEEKIDLYWSLLAEKYKNTSIAYAFLLFKENLIKKEVFIPFYSFKNVPILKDEFLSLSDKIMKLQYTHLRFIMKFVLKCFLFEIPSVISVSLLKTSMREIYFLLKSEGKETFKNLIKIQSAKLDVLKAMDKLYLIDAIKIKKEEFLKEGNSLLHYAILLNDEALFLEAVKNKKDLNLQNFKGETPLILASKLHRTSFVKKLIKKKINFDLQDVNGQTSLHYLIELDNKKLIEMLHKAGAKLNILNNKGKTPLYLSIQNGYDKSALALIELGAFVMTPSLNGKRAIHLAFQRERKALFKPLLDKMPMGVFCDKNLRTFLHFAAFSGQKDWFELLQEKGIDINSKDIFEQTPLHVAACFSDSQTVLKLLELGADVSLKDKYGQTALHLAAAVGNVKIVRVLLEHGAFIDEKDNFLQTPLYLAVLNLQAKVVKELMGKRANPYILTKHQLSASFLIKKGKHRGFKAFLKEYETSFDFYYSLIKLAILKGNVDLIKKGFEQIGVLEKIKKQPNLLLEMALLTKNEIVMQTLVAYGLKFNGVVKENMGQSALISSIMHKNIDNLKLLLTMGADINSYDRGTKHSLLHKAVLMGQKNLVEFLLKNGVDVNFKDIHGRTALWWARHLKFDLIEKELLLYGVVDDEFQRPIPY